MFNFEGSVDSSKSIYNRSLIIQSYNKEIKINGKSLCEDVTNMRMALKEFDAGKTQFQCGDAGTTLRFLMAFLSRKEGSWKLFGSERLLSRPHRDLVDVLKQLGTQVEVKSDHMLIVGSEWQDPKATIKVPTLLSSQFMSAILLNSWDLPFELRLQTSDTVASEAYLVMTLILLQNFGLIFRQTGNGDLYIAKGQKPKAMEYEVEPDFSSCFAVAACGVLGGKALITGFPERSIQPDRLFVKLFEAMGVKMHFDGKTLKVYQTEKIRPVEVDVSNTPDLFPVLSILLAKADGESLITGFESIQHKESDRLKNSLELLKKIGCKYNLEKKQLKIFGTTAEFRSEEKIDPDHDHRMAMAAQVANMGGAKFDIMNKDVVNKSFPGFWELF